MKDALTLAAMQFLNWGLCTISYRAAAQANIAVTVTVDLTLANLQWFVMRRIAKTANDDDWRLWLGYTIGGVLGTVCGIYASVLVLGR